MCFSTLHLLLVCGLWIVFLCQIHVHCNFSTSHNLWHASWCKKQTPQIRQSSNVITCIPSWILHWKFSTEGIPVWGKIHSCHQSSNPTPSTFPQEERATEMTTTSSDNVKQRIWSKSSQYQNFTKLPQRCCDNTLVSCGSCMTLFYFIQKLIKYRIHSKLVIVQPCGNLLGLYPIVCA